MMRRLTLPGVALLVAAWLAGLVLFSLDAMRSRYDLVRCDGIVALTGGAERVEVAIDLLERGFGRDLLISGVGAHTTLPQLRLREGSPLSLLPSDHITLGRRAISTIGNAAETAGWVRAHQIHTLLVVTAGYHVRRAIIEIHRAVPEVELYPYPIQSPALRHPSSLYTARLLTVEYMKWLGSLLRFSRGENLKPDI